MNCLICGVHLGTEPLNEYKDYGVHTACVEKLHQDDPAWQEWREAMQKVKKLIDKNKDET